MLSFGLWGKQAPWPNTEGKDKGEEEENKMILE
jgi:hypothetical protein